MAAMLRTTALVTLAVLLVLAAVPSVDAARSGTYRCVVGVPEGGIAWIYHYNPTTVVQTVTRVRMWNELGDLFDTGTINFRFLRTETTSCWDLTDRQATLVRSRWW